MSVPKITSKNLSFNNSLPPFLQRLHNANSSSDGRHERAIARPKRARDADADAEDEPAYVDETTNHTLSREEYAAFVAGDDELEQEAKIDPDSQEAPSNKEISTAKEATISIGAVRKRKAIKVIGGDASDGEDADVKPTKANATTAKKNISDKAEGGKAGTAASEPAKTSKPTNKKKKKKKMMKLSFGDDD